MAAFASASPSPSISASPWRMDSLRAALPGGQAPVVVLALGASAAATASSVGCLGSFSCLTPVSPLLSLGAENSSFEHRLFGIDARGRILAVRHGKRVPKLNRPPEAWKNGRIKTTKTRAKAMRKYVEKMITLAKDGSLHKRRQALAFIYEKHTVHALFAEVADRNGGERGGLHKDHPNISKAGR